MGVRAALCGAFGAIVLALLPGAATAGSGIQWRPPDGGDFAYQTPELTFSGTRVVVHWVDRGGYAPALNDDDDDGVPDYVEQVAAAGDAAVAFYERRGFRAAMPDTGGPDSRPDLYLVELPFGYFGFMAPPSVSFDGAFVVLSAHLDPREPIALGSLRATVGHELFHVVQHAYTPDLPPWVAEGTADALASLAAPEAHDFAEELRRSRWAARASGAIAANDPYGSAPLWRYLEVLDPGFLAALFDRRARLGPAGEAADPSWYRTLATVYRARRHGSVDVAFARFARTLVLERVLAAAGRVRPGATSVGFCGPLSIRVLRLVLPPQARAVRVELTGTGTTLPHAQLMLPDGRVVVARTVGRTARLRAVLRGGERLGARLILTGRALARGGSAVKLRRSVELRLAVTP
jgi:hypothetical protein